MPKIRGFSKGPTKLRTIRFDIETDAFYASKANEAGLPVSEYIRNLLVQGVIAESVQNIEARLSAFIDKIGGVTRHTDTQYLGENIRGSVFLSEAILGLMVAQSNPAQLKEAEQYADSRVNDDVAPVDAILLKSQYVVEALLTEIAEQKSPQLLYQAQNLAKNKQNIGRR